MDDEIYKNLLSNFLQWLCSFGRGGSDLLLQKHITKAD